MVERILQWNVRGIRARASELSLLLKEQNPSCVCLQELKLSNSSLPFNISKLYKTYSKLPDNNLIPKGGSMIALKTNIPHNQITLNTALQAVAVSLPTGELKSICSVYLPPNDPVTEDQLLNLTTQLPKPALIVGDFNAHNPLWYDQNLDERGEIVQNLTETEDLLILNEDCPTFFRTYDQATSNIDLALISRTCQGQFTWSALDDLHGSDHYPITITAHHSPPPDIIEKWNLKRADWNAYKDLALTKKRVEASPNVEEAYSHLKNTIINAAISSIPRTKINKTKRPNVPWWTNKCKIERTNVRSAFKTMKRNPNLITAQTYRRRLAIKVRTYRQAKTTSWREYVSQLKPKTPTSQIWKKIRKIEGRYIPKPNPILRVGRDIKTSQEEVANIFVEYYASISRFGQRQQVPQHKNQTQLNEDIDINLDFRMRELEESLKQLEEGKSTGQDQIDNSMLKHLPLVTKQYLLDLYNKLWNEGSFPKEWRTSIIIPILKPGKEPTNPRNYRPISLTSCVCKLLERMVNNRLMWFLEKTHKLSPQQYGFRQGRNTIDPIAAITTDILNGFKQNKTTTAIFFDFEKAFDTINRQTITTNLRHMGIQGKMLRFVENYLEDRTIKVKIGNTLSSDQVTQTGVPQGGVLSATCFIVAINTILDVMPQDVKGSLYADDLVIYRTSKNIQTSSRILQNSIKKLEEWAKNVGLRFSPSKSETVHFWRGIKGGNNRDYTTLKLYNKEIPNKESTKFLGVILDRKLNWIPHIQSLKAEALRSLNILRVVSRINYGPDRKTLLQLYWAICKSKIDYGSQIYSSASLSTLDKLNSVHNQALRICTGAFRSSPEKSLQVEAGSPPLDLQRDDQCLRYILRLESSPEYVENMNVLKDQYDTLYERNEQQQVPIGTRGRHLKQTLDFDPDTALNPIAEVPSWLLTTVNICREGAKVKKRNTTTSQLQQDFLLHMSKHSSTKHIYTDGSKSQSGVGFGIVYGQNLERCIRGTLPVETTIFAAEIQAILRALTVIEDSIHLSWTIFTDSQSSLQAITQLKPKHPLVKTIQTRLIGLQHQQKKICFCKIPSHVGIRGNEAADKAANESLELPGLHTTKVYHRDYHFPIRRSIMNRWQSRWDQQIHNKLKQSKPCVKPWSNIPGGNRRNETKITRLRIGHTRLTHSYYMSRGRPPECTFCGESPLTTKHFLTECQITQPIRQRLNLPSNLQELLGERCPVTSLIEYLSELRILNDI